ncbi:XRE family transcriptional regulator [Mesobacillus campisalis]|uniref:XRE family transcriptional regulator n=1 Tax=Mesobacillus campisalis TaxID=1408103 RepID=A0A0M2SXJ6_9BACI|nr:helix-turn-helix transcriptional regulator [Mesobacillus campisalis]KKK39304.1 XRE family transcriptional regulator [Mesobacillus campisalis]
MSAVGANIKSIREQRGMTLEELALKARVGKQTIEKYETGTKTPDNQTLLKLATILDVPASELYLEKLS